MRNPLSVQIRKAFAQILVDAGDTRLVWRPFAAEVFQCPRSARGVKDKIHREIGTAAGDVDVKMANLDESAMIQSGEQPAFRKETLLQKGRMFAFIRKDL